MSDGICACAWRSSAFSSRNFWAGYEGSVHTVRNAVFITWCFHASAIILSSAETLPSASSCSIRRAICNARLQLAERCFRISRRKMRIGSGAPTRKVRPGPPMTLGNAVAARLRLMVWCKACGYRSEPDPANQARWYGPETPVPEWRGRLVCSQCGSRNVDSSLSWPAGSEPRAGDHLQAIIVPGERIRWMYQPVIRPGCDINPKLHNWTLHAVISQTTREEMVMSDFFALFEEKGGNRRTAKARTDEIGNAACSAR